MLTKTTNFEFGSFTSPEKNDSGLMKERSFTSDSYRFGFGGQEKDDEVSGTGNSMTAEYWQYDSRLGRRWNMDMVMKPFESLYSAFACNPIYFIDKNGKDAVATVVTNQRKFLFWSWTKTTLIIKADYHYIEGQIDESILSSVSSEYGEFKRMSYNGVRANVRFEINFIPHPEGTELDKEYDGTNGQNFLMVRNIPDQQIGEGRIEESYYKGIFLDIEKINSIKTESPNGEELRPSMTQKKDILKYAILHGIGHNIGFTHEDKGVMNSYKTGYIGSTDLLDKTKTRYNFAIDFGLLNNSNVQALVNRIDKMSSSKRQYWQNKTEISPEGKEIKLENTGVTTIKSD